MKISFFESGASTAHVEKIDLQDNATVLMYTDLINDGGQLSWTLNPSRLRGKLGTRGKLYGLVSDDGNPVGVIGIKEIVVSGVAGGEIGYLYVAPSHRSLSNVIQLYHAAINDASHFPFLMATTVTTNKQVNTLLARARKMKNIFTAKSPFSSNLLNYWVSTENSGAFTFDEVKELFVDQYGHNIVEDNNTLNEAFVFQGVDRAPASFQSLIYKMAESNPMISLDEGNPDDIKMVFGRQDSLPTEDNTVYIGNRFFSKSKQYKILRGIVPTIKTFEEYSELQGADFIAKRNIGQKQAGQMINQRPEDDSGYIYQPLLNIESEYRVITYYMNGTYHVSGVYEKTGSNVSLRSITSGEIYEKASSIAKVATKALGYGLSGVDIALVEKSSNINESSLKDAVASRLGKTAGKMSQSEVIGAMASTLGRMAGKMSQSEVGDNHILVLLEVNTMPSMSNPMIVHETFKHILNNKK